MYRTQVYRSRRHSKLSLLAFVVLFVVSLIGIGTWRSQSHQVLSVQSGSMAPAIQRGDAVVLEPLAKDNLRVGDIVTYRSPADQSVLVTHRVVSINRNWNLIITKGDNVSRNDKPVAMSEIIGKVDARIAYLGFVLDCLRTPAGLVAAVYMPAAVIVGLELKRLAAHYTRPTYRLPAYSRR